eukprot:9306530-Lingulodinium_polyedra.AAC.1
MGDSHSGDSAFVPGTWIGPASVGPSRLRGAARHLLRPYGLAHRAVFLRCRGEARHQAFGRAAAPGVQGGWAVAPQA